MDKSLISAILIFHDVLATCLLVTISWQAFVAWTPRAPAGPAVPLAFSPARLGNVVALLFVAVIFLGALLYPSYRLMVRPYLETHDLRGPNGMFEIKEHCAALALLTLPAYRAAWAAPATAGTGTTRKALTALLCAMVWWNFLAGHVMNAIMGLTR